jgi:hypothetical protein
MTTEALTTWLPDRFLFDPEPAATFEVMMQYMILIERLVREGKSEAEIDAAVRRLVDEDARALEQRLDEDELPQAA